jgi:[histone H3]-lysine79 N-trimethyltransferase
LLLAFPLTKSTQQEVSLYYPALSTPETYCITVNKDPDNFQPANDIVCTIELIAKNFLPADKAELVLVDGPEGILHKIKRAWKKSEPQEFFAAVERFNRFIQPLRKDGVLERVLKKSTTLSFDLIEHILGQSYARTVALDVDELRKYEAFSNNVYGELLPRFTSQVFKDANLRSDSVFVDLGSGIGNVVLHAALEVGCESWGCEVMPAAADLAEKQAKEFRSRCKLWGIRPGKVELRKGDFLEVPDIPSALRRADLLVSLPCETLMVEELLGELCANMVGSWSIIMRSRRNLTPASLICFSS